MIRYLILFGVLILSFTWAYGQDKIVQRKGDKGTWIGASQKGFVVGVGSDQNLEIAKEKALLYVRETIVRSIAEEVEVETQLTVKESSGAIESYLDNYASTTTAQSKDSKALSGISESKVEKWYWERLKNKSSKVTYYKYYVLYPFSDAELNRLIEAYKMHDRALTDKMELASSMLRTSESLEEVLSAQQELKQLESLFTDQRKQHTRSELGYYNVLMRSMEVRLKPLSPGKSLIMLGSGDRNFKVYSQPRITSPCATILGIELVEGYTELKYFAEYCKEGSDQNYFEITYSLGNLRWKDRVMITSSSLPVSLKVIEPSSMLWSGNLVSISVILEANSTQNLSIKSLKVDLEDGHELELPLVKQSGEQGQIECTFSDQILPEKTSVVKPKLKNELSGRIMYSEGKVLTSFKLYRLRLVNE
jgi:hypothetical protein